MSRRLLWTDDDGADWFVYEAHMLAAEGWEICWARDVESAIARLRDERFSAVVLDQMLPWRRGEAPAAEAVQIWGGCTVLWWLRQQRWPRAVPFPTRIRDQPFWSSQPLAANLNIPAILVSAFIDEQVEGVTRAASAADTNLEVLAKPVRLSDLQDFLRPIPDTP
ncbi:MAG: hypothetical protein ACI8S6_004037 [Myxococcota bacterium]|jgi:hypothetical protein